MSAATALRLALREAAAQIAANARGARSGRDPEFLHQLRVGTRRLRAALRVSRERQLRARLDPAWRRFVAAPRFWGDIGL